VPSDVSKSYASYGLPSSRADEQKPEMRDLAFAAARDEALAHAGLRSFAKSAVDKRVESGGLTRRVIRRAVMTRVNTTPLRRKNV
jgi:hypothetical protein